MATEPTISELQKKLLKAEKINAALTKRVKRSISSRDSAYSLFESNILLQGAVEKKTRELKVAVEIAEAAAKKGEFLANMSHEIRTPLNGVLGMMYLLGKTELDIKQQRFLETATRSGEMLLTVINDILDFSKIEAGKVELECIGFDPVSLAEETTALLAQSAHSKGLELICVISPSVPTLVHGDPVRIRQVITNLLNNAIKFTHKGEVVLSISYAKTNLQFSVKDSGIGISDEQRERLFTPFSQADSSHTRKYGGTGLGLSICQFLVGAMGGKIEVSSTPDIGSVFSFELPFDNVEIKQPLRRCDLSQQHIFIIEKNKTVRHALKNMLGHWQVSKITEAESTTTALSELHSATERGQNYDVVIADMTSIGMKTSKQSPFTHKGSLEKAKWVFLHPLDFQEPPTNKNAYVRKPIRQSDLYGALLSLLNNPNEEDNCASVEKSSHRGKDYYFKDQHILLVEDNVINQEVACEILAGAGFNNIDVRENGAEAVAAVKEKEYDLVLMDIQMPVMDGLLATQTIRSLGDQSPALKILPIIAMTAHAVTGDSDKSFAAGMNGHVTKPIDPEHLFSTLAQWLTPSNRPTELGAKEDTNSRQQSLPDLPGIDVQDGLNRLRGNWKTYQRLLFSFCDKHNDAANQLATFIEKSHWQEATRLAHTLKGSGGNLGAKQLYVLAATMEQHCIAKDFGASKVQLHLLSQCLTTIFTGITAMTPPQTVDVNHGEFDIEKWQTDLKRLLTLLDEDLISARGCLDELKKQKTNHAETTDLKELENALNIFDTDAAKQIIKRQLDTDKEAGARQP